MRRILVTGRGGQLAASLAAALPARGFVAGLVGRPAFDLTQPETITAAFVAARPEAVVNCAAWTAVDAAEDAPGETFHANALGPALVAAHCAAAGIPMIQISTDYVFDGRKGAPYVESDPPNPQAVYGRSKLAGEWAALAVNPQTIVLRTAWLHAPTGRNFVRTMLSLAAERPVLRVVADQRGTPTAAPDLADAIVAILSILRDGGWKPAYRGVFHATNGGETSWHGFAEAIFAEAARFGGPTPQVEAIATADWPTKAARPADARLDGARLRAVFGIGLPPWQDGLRRVLRGLYPSV